jgi:putative ATP-dependent endonuclease of OLD family
MYLSAVTVENFRCFGSGDEALGLHLKKGLTALVGENDGGKTAFVDALRFALGTTDQEWMRIEDSDFHNPEEPIRVACRFDNLTEQDERAFVEFLNYGQGVGEPPFLCIHITVPNVGELRGGRLYRRSEIRSGTDGSGPSVPPEVRDLLRATYLRPLRDADRALTAGRGSRLSEVLSSRGAIGDRGDPSALTGDFDIGNGLSGDLVSRLSVIDIGRVTDMLLSGQKRIGEAKTRINANLQELTIRGEELRSDIRVGERSASEDARLRLILEKLDLVLDGAGRPGLGSSNLLFMACELLLLSRQAVGSKLLLIEEPEAHLHPQRQLRVVRFLREQARDLGIQVIMTTHSPNVASVVSLDNLVMVRRAHAYSMAEGETRLERSDYRFLERHLDVTKASLFFARAVMIVEGPSEAILLPQLASLLGRDLAEYGVSIVNVGGVGLRRFARILQRRKEAQLQLDIPVACLADLDVMPDCAPEILGLVKQGSAWPANRRWRAVSDFSGADGLADERKRKRDVASGQNVETFVADAWTFEYDLALRGLAEEVYVSAALAARDERISSGLVDRSGCVTEALSDFGVLRGSTDCKDGDVVTEALASKVYARFATENVSKAIAAQYLAEILREKRASGSLELDELLGRLPQYVIQAIEYVTEPVALPLPGSGVAE